MNLVKKLVGCLPLVVAWTLSTGAAACPLEGLPVQSVTLSGGNKVYAHTSGLSLYTFDVDGLNVSNCYQRCAEVWPPVLLSDDEAAAVTAPFSVVQRTTNLKQLALNGKPLYLYYLDRRTGDLLGDGVGGVWHLVPSETVTP